MKKETAPSVDVAADQEEVHVAEGAAEPAYQKSTSDSELKDRYLKYLNRNKWYWYAEYFGLTVESNMAFIFSEEPNSFLQYCKRLYGEDFSLFKFECSVEGDHQVMDPLIMKKFAAALLEATGAWIAHDGVKAVMELLDFFYRSSVDLRQLRGTNIDMGDYCENVSEWTSKLNKSREELKLILRSLVQKKRHEMEKARKNYFGSPEMTAWLARIERMAEDVHRGKGLPDQKDFEDVTRWLLLATYYFNGADKQNAQQLHYVNLQDWTIRPKPEWNSPTQKCGLKGQSHEIFLLWFFPSICSFWSY